MIEEISKRPGWGHLLSVAEETGYHKQRSTFRSELKGMSRQDLAEVLADLQS